MKLVSTRRVTAGLLGLGLAVAPLSGAMAATKTPKTYPVQVTLEGSPCLVKGASLTKWNLTYTVTSNYGTPGRQGVQNGGTKSTTHTFNVEKAGSDGWFLVQTWCGRNGFSRLLGRAGDSCGSVPSTATASKPAKVTIQMGSPLIGQMECVGY